MPCLRPEQEEIILLLFQTSVIPTEEDADVDVMNTMCSLQCFKDKQKLIEELLSPK